MGGYLTERKMQIRHTTQKGAIRTELYRPTPSVNAARPDMAVENWKKTRTTL